MTYVTCTAFILCMSMYSVFYILHLCAHIAQSMELQYVYCGCGLYGQLVQ